MKYMACGKLKSCLKNAVNILVACSSVSTVFKEIFTKRIYQQIIMCNRMCNFKIRIDVKSWISTLRFEKQQCLKKCSEYGNYII